MIGYAIFISRLAAEFRVAYRELLPFNGRGARASQLTGVRSPLRELRRPKGFPLKDVSGCRGGLGK